MTGIVLQVFAHRRNRLFLLLLILFPRAAMYAQDPTPDELVKAANAASDLEKAGPYRMDGTVVVYSDRKQIATGQVRLDRDKDHFREQLHFTDYDEIVVTVGDKVYVWRSPHVPLDFSTLQDLDRLWQISLPVKAIPGALKKMEVHSAPALCFEAKLDKGSSRRSCFDPGTRLVTSDLLQDPYETRELVFSNYEAFEGEEFPNTVAYMRNGAPFFEVRDIKVTKAQFETEYFTPPQGASEFDTCRDPQSPRLVKHVAPEYPAIARMSHVRGEVRLMGVIGKEGRLTNLRVISGNPVLAAAALDALKQWRYVPAMCPSGPVERETQLKIAFSM